MEKVGFGLIEWRPTWNVQQEQASAEAGTSDLEVAGYVAQALPSTWDQTAQGRCVGEVASEPGQLGCRLRARPSLDFTPLDINRLSSCRAAAIKVNDLAVGQAHRNGELLRCAAALNVLHLSLQAGLGVGT